MSQVLLEEKHPFTPVKFDPSKRLKQACGSIKNVRCRDVGKAAAGWVPSVSWIPKYKPKQYLLGDCLVGLTVGIMNIPQGMAYGMLAGLDPKHGLYTSFFIPFIYTFFGTSKHVALGTFAIVALMFGTALDSIVSGLQGPISSNISSHINHTLGSTVAPMSGGIGTFWCGSSSSHSSDTVLVFQIAAALTMVIGLLQIGMSLLRMGFLGVLLSDQVVQGLTTGAAMFVFTVQVKHLLGIEELHRPAGVLGLVKFYVCTFANIKKTNIATLVTSLICIACLVFVKEIVDPKTRPKIKIPIPMELIVVIISTGIMYGAKLPAKFNIAIVGNIPRGISAPKFPTFWNHFGVLLPNAIPIAIVMYCVEVSLAKMFAKKHEYKIDQNQEWFALGLAHCVGSLFVCHAGGSSLSRSMIMSNQGAKSQVPHLVSCSIIILVLYVAAPLFTNLPKCILSSIIVVALKGMYKQLGNLPPLWKKSKIDFAIWVTTFVAVVLLGITYGLAVGIGFSLLTVMYRSFWPTAWILGRVSHSIPLGGHKETPVYHKLRTEDHIRVFRFDSPLYYGNAEKFKELLFSKTGTDPMDIKKARRKAEKKAKKYQKSMVSDGKSSSSGVMQNPAWNIDINTEGESVGVKCIIIDCSCISFVDVQGVDALAKTHAEYKEVTISVLFADLKAQVLELFETCQFFDKVPKENCFTSVGAAMSFTKKTDKQIDEIS